jgi:predicted transcriptional regulator
MNLTIRIPDQVFRALKEYREQVKPHLSQNAIIVEAIIEEVKLKTSTEAALERREQPAEEER